MISELTRRDMADLLAADWSGRLTAVEFLGRLYDLRKLPSTDRRHPDMAGDVGRHTPPANDDWPREWVFSDGRLGLQEDQAFLRFVAETVHPAVVTPDLRVDTRVHAINKILTPDGFELASVRAISGKPIFEARRTIPRRAPSEAFSSSMISGMAKILSETQTHSSIDSLFEDQDFPRPREFGNNKVDKVKAWLRAAHSHGEFDHWQGLGKVLAVLLEPVAAEGTPEHTYQSALRTLLAASGLTYLAGGMLTIGVGGTHSSIVGTPDLSLPPPTEWRRLGQGGFGTVYAVRDEELGVEFALKVFDPSPFTGAADASVRFLREAGLLFRLHHEHIVRIFHAGKLADGRPFIRMERFAGDSLQTFLDGRSVTIEEGVIIVGRLAAALEHAHARGIYHRDLKPTNVLVSADLGDLRLIDFGLGILVEEAVARSRLTTSDHHFGGAYTAPELLENPKILGPELDVYSLGAVWFRLVIGRTPQGAGIDNLIDGTELSADLKVILRRCLSGRDTRPTMRELRAQLRQWVRTNRGSGK